MTENLEKEIPVLICNLEKILSRWFNPMQHLIVHLSCEADVGGPVQYRLIYHIKRVLKYLRVMVGNKVKVEGCIAEVFLLKEITSLSVYFVKQHNVNALLLYSRKTTNLLHGLRYNVDDEPPLSDLKIFQWKGTTASNSMTYCYTKEKRTPALLYIYSNVEEMEL
jgi:hypothetical protein